MKQHSIHRHILLALAAMFSAAGAQAACVDDGWAYTCSGASAIADTLVEKPVYLDASSGANTFTNVTKDPFHEIVPGYDYYNTYWMNGYYVNYIWDPVLMVFVPDPTSWVDGYWQTDHYFQQAEYGATIKTTAFGMGAVSTISASGSNPVTVNNIGGKLTLDGSSRSYFSDGWYNDAAGKLYNSSDYGNPAGMAAVISAGPEVSSLTVNNLTLNPDVFYPHLGYSGSYGMRSEISGNGAYTAGIYTNSPVLTVYNTGMINSIYSFGGATYTPPAIQDGSQYATLTRAGITDVTVGDGTSNGYGYIGSLYVVDRDPVLTQAQQEAADAGFPVQLAYDTNAVGPRNSVINVADHSMIGSLYLGSGAHVVNVANQYDSNGIDRIVVDQGDAEVVAVTEGVANTLYKVHGERTFTLNSYNQYGHDITLNDVAGAVNTLNFFALGQSYASITATGYGSPTGSGTNTLNLNCAWAPDIFLPDTARCDFSNTVTGMTSINMTGQLSTVSGAFQATDAINLLGQHYFTGNLSAPTVTVDSGTTLAAYGNPDRWTNQIMGDIHGNLVNRGTVYLGDATLDVTAYTDPATGNLMGGNAIMNPGSLLKVGIGPDRAGYLNTAGTTSFANGATVAVNIKHGTFVENGESHVIANNISGMPTMVNGTSFVQWGLSVLGGDLLLTADVGISNALAPLVTPAARNAANAFFASSSSEPQVHDLQATLQTFEGEEVIRAAERLHPETNDGAIRMVLNNTDRLFGILDSRLLDSYLAASPNGFLQISAKPDTLTPGAGIWVQGFGDRGRQDTLHGVDGYSTSSAGMAAGADRALDAYGNLRAGFAFGYARGNITNAGNTVNNRIDTNSFLAMIYGRHTWEQWYLNGALGIGRTTYDTSRQLLQYSASGSHDSWQVAARVDAGWPILFQDNLAFVPMASFDYNHLHESGYTENGVTSVALPPDPSGPYVPPEYQVPVFENRSSPINLQVDSRSVDSYRAGLGGKLIYTLQQPDWAAELELHGMLRHEFGDIAQDTAARFVFGGDRFLSPGLKPARNGIQLGGTVRLTGTDENDQLTLLTSYDADVREEYFGQTVTLNVQYDFDQAPRYNRLAAARKIAALDSMAAPAQLVNATEQDIATFSQAMQPGALRADDPETRAQTALDLTLSNWINAQSSKNLEVYFNSYAANFAIPDGNSRQQWERKRKGEIARAANTPIRVSHLTVKPNGDKAMALFTQTTGEETVQKIVDLENRNGRWLIVREDSIALNE